MNDLAMPHWRAAIAAVRGRRDEETGAIRMLAAAFRGRMKEAAELATDYRRAPWPEPRQQAGGLIMQIAISEALYGLDERQRANREG